MSTSVADVDDEVYPEGEGFAHGPSDKQYFTIFWILVALTALEVSTYWWEDWFGEAAHKVAVPLLFILMFVKFFLVALFFMHLKFDNPLLKRLFYFGAIVAVAVYVGAMSSMNFWEDSGTTRVVDPPPEVTPVVPDAEGAGGG